VKLTVLERLLLLGLLPKRGNLTTLKIVRDLENELSFSEEEHARLQFNSTDDSVKWQVGAEQDKEIEFGPKAQTMVRDVLAELDKQETLTMQHLSLCEKFRYESDDATE